jgi:hypothetical protein
MLNEILQWIAIGAALAPHVTRVVRDFREEEEDG